VLTEVATERACSCLRGCWRSRDRPRTSVGLGFWPQPLISFAHQASLCSKGALSALLVGTWVLSGAWELISPGSCRTAAGCEVLFLQRRDDGLELVPLLAGDADLLALGL